MQLGAAGSSSDPENADMVASGLAAASAATNGLVIVGGLEVFPRDGNHCNECCQRPDILQDF